jgi:hypothetical protein
VVAFAATDATVSCVRFIAQIGIKKPAEASC